MKILARALPPLTLFEWGAILGYFYLSGRIASFLHPMFRPCVLVTAILLVITAVVVAIFPEEGCGHAHEHALEHEEEHVHGKLTPANVVAFLLLLIPLALAATVSTDNYGADLIRRRGLVEDIRALPGVKSRVSQLPSSRPVNQKRLASLPAQAAAVRESIARAAAALRDPSHNRLTSSWKLLLRNTVTSPVSRLRMEASKKMRRPHLSTETTKMSFSSLTLPAISKCR